MDKIWIVQGSTGEYSDHIEWAVCFYAEEWEAMKKIEFLSAKHRESMILFPGFRSRERVEVMRKFDRDYQFDGSGINYICYPVERGL